MEFEKACHDGNLQIVQTMIKNGASNWDFGLFGACIGGHTKIAQMMIEKGTTNWNLGLYGACRGGHFSLAKLMIQKGASDWNGGLWRASGSGQMHLAQLMVEQGAEGLDYLNVDQMFWLLEQGTRINRFDKEEKFKSVLQEIQLFRQKINTLRFCLIPDLLNLVSEYSLK